MNQPDILAHIKARCTEQADCWIWNGCLQDCGATPTIRYKQKTYGVRVLVANERGINRKGKLMTSSCGHPRCVSPDHCEPVTRKELQMRIAASMTVAERMSKARKAFDISAPRLAKLDWDKVREIRNSTGQSQAELAKKYGVTKSAISLVMLNKSWRETANNPFNQLFYASQQKAA